MSAQFLTKLSLYVRLHYMSAHFFSKVSLYVRPHFSLLFHACLSDISSQNKPQKQYDYMCYMYICKVRFQK